MISLILCLEQIRSAVIPGLKEMDQSLYWWQKEIGSLTPSQAWLRKVLERENELLKRLMTDLSLANQQVKDQVWRYLEDGRLYKMESGLLSGVGDQ